jgi:hypothetical protein
MVKTRDPGTLRIVMLQCAFDKTVGFGSLGFQHFLTRNDILWRSTAFYGIVTSAFLFPPSPEIPTLWTKSEWKCPLPLLYKQTMCLLYGTLSKYLRTSHPHSTNQMQNRKQIAMISGPKCRDVLLCSMEEEQGSKKRAGRNLDTQKAE